jgi:hypothetical protein
MSFNDNSDRKRPTIENEVMVLVLFKFGRLFLFDALAVFPKGKWRRE